MKTPAVLVSLLAMVVTAVAAGMQWTIENLTRRCDNQDTTCTYNFTINNPAGGTGRTPCSYTVDGGNASRLSGNSLCYPYNVESMWNNQFTDYYAFTTFFIVNNQHYLFIIAAYPDREIGNGAAVTPSQSFNTVDRGR